MVSGLMTGFPSTSPGFVRREGRSSDRPSVGVAKSRRALGGLALAIVVAFTSCDGSSGAQGRSYCDVVGVTRSDLSKIVAMVMSEREGDRRAEGVRQYTEVVKKRRDVAPVEISDEFDHVVSELDAGRAPGQRDLTEIASVTLAQCGGVDDLSPNER